MSTHPVLVLLAAGASSRLGEPKALVDLGGQTPLERLFAAATQGQAVDAICIAGAHYEEIRERAPDSLEVIEHRGWRAGRTSSLQAAQRARENRDLLIAPVDVPLVPKLVFEQLTAAWIEADSPDCGWLAPAVTSSGKLRMGHPVLIGRRLAVQLEALDPALPLRNLRQRADPLFYTEVASERILDDLDTPADLKKLRTLM